MNGTEVIWRDEETETAVPCILRYEFDKGVSLVCVEEFEIYNTAVHAGTPIECFNLRSPQYIDIYMDALAFWMGIAQKGLYSVKSDGPVAQAIYDSANIPTHFADELRAMIIPAEEYMRLHCPFN